MISFKILDDLSRRNIAVFLALVLSVGMLIRIFGGLVFNYGYDVHHWAQVMAVISSGNGLYGLTGYFYTPVWGYILGFMNMLQQGCLTLGETAFRVTGALCFEDYSGYISSNTTSLVYTFWVKLPLYLVDLIVACLVYYVVMEITGDRRKAILGFALWFLNPLVILAPMVQGMFDNITAMMTLVCIICLRKRFFFMAGAMLGLAILLKLFPVFLMPLLISYLIVKEDRNIRASIIPLVLAAVGVVVVAVLVFLPQLMDGTLEYCFTFITARASSHLSLLDTIASKGTVLAYIGIILGSIFIAIAFYKFADRDSKTDLLRALMVNLSLMFLVPSTPQYLVLFMPFITISMMVFDGKFRKPWAVIMVGATLYVLGNGPSLFLTLGTDSGILALTTVVDWANAYEPYWFYVFYSGNVIQYVGVLYLIYEEYREHMFDIRFWKKATYGKESCGEE